MLSKKIINNLFSYLVVILLVSKVVCQTEVYNGLTIFSAGTSMGKTILINNQLEIIKQWDHPAQVIRLPYLYPDSTLLIQLAVDDPYIDGNGAEGGWFQKLDWDGNVIWEWTYYGEYCTPHHDVEPLPNGNVVIICWDVKTQEEAQAMGRQNNNGGMWPLKLVEFQPIGPDSGTVVWEWNIWDHTIQDMNSSLENYGVIAEHPERIDINRGTFPNNIPDWIHTNAIHHNAELDQLIFSSRRLSEIFIIDHSTTTEEAAGQTGGQYGVGGDFLYRWGNPQNYNMGTDDDQMLNAQHGSYWIPAEYPGAGNILIFNNNPFTNTTGVSSVVEIIPPLLPDGSYSITQSFPFEPVDYYWACCSDFYFFSNTQSGAFRMPNGNTLVTVKNENRIFEVNSLGELLWDVNLNVLPGIIDNVSRAQKYETVFFNFPKGDVGRNHQNEIIDLLLLSDMVFDELPQDMIGDMNDDQLLDEHDIIILKNKILDN